MVTDRQWAAMLRFDSERGLESLRHDAAAAGHRGDGWEQARCLREAAQLELLPRLWEIVDELTEDEYAEAGRVRSWITHEQQIAMHEERARRQPSSAYYDRDRINQLRSRTRYFWSPDGHLMYVAVRDDGRHVANHRPLTTEWAEQLRRDMPQLAQLVTLYEQNQATGRGHEGAPYSTPLPDVSEPEPLRLWRERMEGQLRRKAAEQAEADDAAPDGRAHRLPDTDPSGR